MSIEGRTKINNLLTTLPAGAVVLSSWLREQGYSPSLQQRYRQSHWLESMGAGAMIRAGDEVGYEGAVYALQKQAGMSVHPGGRTALALQGKAHYLQLSAKKVVLFGGEKERLPSWFQKHDWGTKMEYHSTSFLPSEVGMTDVEVKSFSIKVSNPVRALMECLYLSPGNQDLIECYELMESLNNLRPQNVQPLLEQCQSVKVKRLFLYLAENAGHRWVKYLDLSNVDLGKGKRSVVKGGAYVPKYQITVPKELYNPYHYLMGNASRLLEIFESKDEKQLSDETPYLRDAWMRRDGAVSTEISVFFSQLLLSNPEWIIKMFVRHPDEFEVWIDELDHFMFTAFSPDMAPSS